VVLIDHRGVRDWVFPLTPGRVSDEDKRTRRTIATGSPPMTAAPGVQVSRLVLWRPSTRAWTPKAARVAMKGCRWTSTECGAVADSSGHGTRTSRSFRTAHGQGGQRRNGAGAGLSRAGRAGGHVVPLGRVGTGAAMSWPSTPFGWASTRPCPRRAGGNAPGAGRTRCSRQGRRWGRRSCTTRRTHICTRTGPGALHPELVAKATSLAEQRRSPRAQQGRRLTERSVGGPVENGFGERDLSALAELLRVPGGLASPWPGVPTSAAVVPSLPPAVVCAVVV